MKISLLFTILALCVCVQSTAQGSKDSDAEKLTMEVLLTLNKVRANPADFIGAIDRYVAHVKSFTKSTKDLQTAASEIKTILKQQKPLEPVNILGMLQSAAMDHSKDIEKKGVLGHIGSDGSNPMTRVNRYGKVSKLAECVTYGHMTAELIIASFLVDEGTPDRGHRKNLLNPDFNKVGIAIGGHPTYKRACVIVLGAI